MCFSAIVQHSYYTFEDGSEVRYCLAFVFGSSWEYASAAFQDTPIVSTTLGFAIAFHGLRWQSCCPFATVLLFPRRLLSSRLYDRSDPELGSLVVPVSIPNTVPSPLS